MPALPFVPGAIKSRIFYQVEGDANAVTIHHWRYSSSAPDETDLEGWLTTLSEAVATRFLPLMVSDVTIGDMDARDLSKLDGAYATASIASPGTRTGTRIAPGTAAVVNYPIKQSYRGGKPRSYYPFGVSADVAATGFWADAFVSAVTAACELVALAGTTTVGGLTVTNMCGISYYGPPNKVITNATTGRARTVSTRRDAPGGTGEPLVYNITDQICSKVIGSQRRRNRNA